MRMSHRGFSLPEMLLVVLTISMAAITALPGMSTAYRRYELKSATREIAGQIRAARLRAVTSNETMRIRFNCPSTGQLRVVQVVNTPAIDDAADRCSAASYPYPDRNAAVEPNLDGPVMVLRGSISLGFGTPDIDIAPTGRMTSRLGPLPASIVVSDHRESRTVRVTAAGRVETL